MNQKRNSTSSTRDLFTSWDNIHENVGFEETMGDNPWIYYVGVMEISKS
jgi:hypothetical protein